MNICVVWGAMWTMMLIVTMFAAHPACSEDAKMSQRGQRLTGKVE